MTATVHPLPPTDRDRLRTALHELAMEREAHRRTQGELRKVTVQLQQTRLAIRSTLDVLTGAGNGRLFQDNPTDMKPTTKQEEA